MRLTKSTDSKPELYVRRLTHAAGFRFRLHHEGLSGKQIVVARALALDPAGHEAAFGWFAGSTRRDADRDRPAESLHYGGN